MPAALPLCSVSLEPGCASPLPAGTELGASVTVAPEPAPTKVAVVALPVGAAVGPAVPDVGAEVGAFVGELVGILLGFLLGFLVGFSVAFLEGFFEGFCVGRPAFVQARFTDEHMPPQSSCTSSSAVGTRVQGYSQA